MINGCHKKISALVPPAVIARYLEIRTYQAHGGYSAEAHDNARTYEPHLLAQKAYAGILLGGKRIAVTRRTALEYICYVNILASDIDRVEIAVEQLTRAPNERNALKVLLLARCLTHKHEPG